MIRGHDIICASTSDWKRPWGSKQQLMKRLAAHNRILYVEYQTSFLHMFSPRLLFRRMKALGNHLRMAGDNIFVLTPYLHLPFGYYSRMINAINQRMLLRQIQGAAKKLNFRKPILWIYPPCSVKLVGELGEQLVLYHCIADFSNEKKNSLRNKITSLLEKELAEKSDIILVLTEPLFRKYRNINPNTYLFPSAVDENLFSSFISARKEEPPDIVNLKRPRIGLVGYLDGDTLDIELLSYIADMHREWSLVLIGPTFRHFTKLRALYRKDNMYFLGEKEHNCVPFYIESLDVCIIPYIRNKFTYNVSPLKLYEYLALGKPIVSTRLAGIEKFGEVIRLSDTKEEFVRNISLALAEKKDSGLFSRRIEIAKQNSWGERLKAVSMFAEGKLK